MKRALTLIALAAVCVPAASAQVQVRGRAITTAQYIELRPLVYSPADSTFVAAPRTSATPLIEDLELSGWGFGVPGLRAYALVRARTALGSDLIWPRSDDHFDALWFYAELDRPEYRLRLGRQQRASGLGWYAFDGLTATLRPATTLRVEAYGGRALARGFLEPMNSDAIRAIDPLIPDQSSLIFGTSLWLAPTPASAFTALYQVVELSDFSGVVSERAALDGQVGVGHGVVIRGSTDIDIASSALGRSRLAAIWQGPRATSVEAALFRYRPTFDLTTIWGVFAPQANKGVEFGARTQATRQLQIGAGYLYRWYEPTTATNPFDLGVSDHTHQLSISGSYVEGDYRFEGAYHLSSGYGGWRSGGEGELAYDRGGLWHAGVHAAAFQGYQDFRVASGTVYGAGASIRLTPRPWMSVHGGFTQYWHTDTKGQAAPDWSQLRADLGLEITFGASADRSGAAR